MTSISSTIQKEYLDMEPKIEMDPQVMIAFGLVDPLDPTAIVSPKLASIVARQRTWDFNPSDGKEAAAINFKDIASAKCTPKQLNAKVKSAKVIPEVDADTTAKLPDLVGDVPEANADAPEADAAAPKADADAPKADAKASKPVAEKAAPSEFYHPIDTNSEQSFQKFADSLQCIENFELSGDSQKMKG